MSWFKKKKKILVVKDASQETLRAVSDFLADDSAVVVANETYWVNS